MSYTGVSSYRKARWAMPYTLCTTEPLWKLLSLQVPLHLPLHGRLHNLRTDAY